MSRDLARRCPGHGPRRAGVGALQWGANSTWATATSRVHGPSHDERRLAGVGRQLGRLGVPPAPGIYRLFARGSRRRAGLTASVTVFEAECRGATLL